MKILKLRFKNLNSLYGEWKIDFTQPEFINKGLFAMTGPTGSGKSTILDAICLALYGKTPRLKVISDSTNEIMSRQTAECFAEVLFESQQGQYICHWSQRRSRNKIDGKLQSPKHEVSDPLTEKPIETKKKEVAKFIEEKSGMDFDRFCKSVLLAQGGFAAFLQASDDERSAILEQMTGSEIYSDISKKVFERQKHEKQLLDNLQLEIKGIEILSDEAFRVINEELEQFQKHSSELSAQRKQMNDTILWLNQIAQLKQDIEKAENKKKETDQVINEFESKKDLLTQLNKVQAIQLDYQNLSHWRKQEQEAKVKLQNLTNSLVDLESKANESAEGLKDQQTKYDKFISTYETETEKINQANILDQVIEKLEKQISKERKLKSDNERSLTAFQKQLKSIQNKYSTLENEHKQNQTYLKEHHVDASLANEIEGVEFQVKALQTQQVAHQELVNDAKQLNQAQDKITKSIESQQSAIGKQGSKIKQLLTKIDGIHEKVNCELSGELLEQIEERLEYKQTELQLRQKISNLEDERNQLSDGKPCPLCGALEHPYAQGNVPKVDKLQVECDEIKKRIKNVYQYQNQIAQQEKLLNEEQQVFQKLENKLEILLAEKQRDQKQLSDNDKRLAEFQAAIEEILKSLRLKLQKYQFDISDDTDFGKYLDQLKTRKIKFQQIQKAIDEFEKTKAQLNQDSALLNKDIESQNSKIVIHQDELKNLETECYNTVEKRIAFVGNQKLDAYKSSLQKQLSQHNQSLEKAKQQKTESEKAMSNCQAQLKDAQQTIADVAPKLEECESHFLDLLKQQEIENENQFLELNKQMGQRENLEKTFNALMQYHRDSEQQIIQLNQKLTSLIAEQKTEEPLDKLQQDLSELEVSYQKVSEQIGAYKKQLSDHQQSQEKLKTKIEKINQQTEVMQKWVNLNELIGSADGKKYRNFAQGLTFELMVNHANQQLEKMTDRYLLVRDQSSPLQLCVIDNYQAGEIRTTKNLSGGESFIVSLALALGLSKMASQKVKVDSLFLDEGFGTLDEEALDMALDTLASLQEDGKTIGIISHVSALKERITTQIQVIPVSGGRSILLEPRCK